MEKILVVDDERDIGLLMSAILKSAGYMVIHAGTLRAARKALKENIFITIFLDLNLDDEHGLSLLPSVHTTQHDIEVVVITASKEFDLHDELEEKKVHSLIHKPFGTEEIFNALPKAG